MKLESLVFQALNLIKQNKVIIITQHGHDYENFTFNLMREEA